MANIFKKFKKRLGSISHDRNLPVDTSEYPSNYIDPVGNINFPTSPSNGNFSPIHRDNSTELTIFWTQSRRNRRSQKDNPIFVDEPVDFYEDFIPPDNAHDFSELPRYRPCERHSWIIPDDRDHDYVNVPRARSLGEIPTYEYDNDRINLAVLKKRRQKKRQQSNEERFGYGTEHLFHKRSGDDRSDSGIYQASDDDLSEGEPIEVLLARKLSEFEDPKQFAEQKENLDTLEMNSDKEPVEDIVAKKMTLFQDNELESDICNNNMNTGISSVIDSDLSDDENDVNASKGSLSYWASSESVGNDDIDQDRSSVNKEKTLVDETNSISETKEINLEENPVDAIQRCESHVTTENIEDVERAISEDGINDIFSHDDLSDTEDKDSNFLSNNYRKLTWPCGSFIWSHNVSSSCEDLPSMKEKELNSLRIRKRRMGHFKADDLFFNMEKTLNELETHLNQVLETQPNDDFQTGLNQAERNRRRAEGSLSFEGNRSNSFSVNESTQRVSSANISLKQPDHSNMQHRSLSLSSLPSSEGDMSPLQKVAEGPITVSQTLDIEAMPVHNANESTFKDKVQLNSPHLKSKNPLKSFLKDHRGAEDVCTDAKHDTFNMFAHERHAQTDCRPKTYHVVKHGKTFMLTSADDIDVLSKTDQTQMISKSSSLSITLSSKKHPEPNNPMVASPPPVPPPRTSSFSYTFEPISHTVQPELNHTPPMLESISPQNGPVPTLASEDEIRSRVDSMLPEFIAESTHMQDKPNDVSAYLNVAGPVNSLTSTGVSIFRSNSSVQYTKQDKKKSLIDILTEGMEVPESDSVYPDRACKRTIMSLMVRCYNNGSDCDWTGELANLQDHLEQCQLIEVSCVNSCGRVDIPRNQMTQHIDADGDCPLAVVSCRYSDVGCKFKARRVDIDIHIQESVEQHLDLSHTRIRELEVRQENICMNGKFLWKISNYEHLVKQSATKKDKEKLCSPPFYTGQYGYKLRAEAFLNGLGQGKGSHLSLYVVIMKGEFDAILPWPFKQNVDFVLVDQDDDIADRQNKIWKLSCERNSDYFKRPNKSKSLGFGCPKFVSLETLQTRNYIKDQTLFIKIEVEPTDMLIFSIQSSEKH